MVNDFASGAQLPPLIIVMMGNQGYGGVGNTAMPYLNSLWDEGQDQSRPAADDTQMYAVTHPSPPKYLAIASGSTHCLSLQTP